MRSAWRKNEVFRQIFCIAAVIRSVAKRHEENSGNREPLSKMERSDILDNVCVYLMFAIVKRRQIWVEDLQEPSQIYAVIRPEP